MFTEHAYYDFEITAARIREGIRNNYIEVIWTLVSNIKWVSDFIGYGESPKALHRWRWYKLPLNLDTIEDKDIQHLVGRKERLKVRSEIFRGRKVYKVVIP